MSDFAADYGSMHEQATSLVNGRQEIENQLTKLKNQVHELTQGAFKTNKASGAFMNSYEEFTTGMNNAIAGLDGMAGYLKKAAESIANHDESLANSATIG